MVPSALSPARENRYDVGRMSAAQQGRPSTTKRPARRDRVLGALAAFNLVKAALLAAVGFGALELVQRPVADRALAWARALGSSGGRGTVQSVVARVSTISPSRLEALGVAAFLYAILYSVEGIGLWRERRWAEYLTVIATASFVPVEIYELVQQVTVPRVSALVLNVVVVLYLVGRLRAR